MSKTLIEMIQDLEEENRQLRAGTPLNIKQVLMDIDLRLQNLQGAQAALYDIVEKLGNKIQQQPIILPGLPDYTRPKPMRDFPAYPTVTCEVKPLQLSSTLDESALTQRQEVLPGFDLDDIAPSVPVVPVTAPAVKREVMSVRTQHYIAHYHGVGPKNAEASFTIKRLYDNKLLGTIHEKDMCRETILGTLNSLDRLLNEVPLIFVGLRDPLINAPPGTIIKSKALRVKSFLTITAEDIIKDLGALMQEHVAGTGLVANVTVDSEHKPFTALYFDVDTLGVKQDNDVTLYSNFITKVTSNVNERFFVPPMSEVLGAVTTEFPDIDMYLKPDEEAAFNGLLIRRVLKKKQ